MAEPTWILGFDGDCLTCRQLAENVPCSLACAAIFYVACFGGCDYGCEWLGYC